MILRNPLFLVCCILFWFNQAIERSGIVLPFIHAYVDDLLAMPVVLGITLQVMRWLYPGGQLLVFSPVHVLVGWLYFSLLLEGLLPLLSTTYTADLWDILCYGIGSLAFYFWINRAQSEKNSARADP